MVAIIHSGLLFFVSLALYIALDMAWIGWLMQSFYQTQFAALATPITMRLGAGLAVWTLIVAGSFMFVVPTGNNLGMSEVFCRGLAFGFIVYGVYDLTNFATLANWPIKLLVIDMAWGTLNNGLLALLITYLRARI